MKPITHYLAWPVGIFLVGLPSALGWKNPTTGHAWMISVAVLWGSWIIATAIREHGKGGK